MLGIGFVNVLDAKIVDNKGEGNGSGIVDKETGSVFRWEVSCLGEYLLKFFVCKHSGLFETVHCSSDFYVVVAIVSHKIVEVVLVNDLLGDFG